MSAPFATGSSRSESTIVTIDQPATWTATGALGHTASANRRPAMTTWPRLVGNVMATHGAAVPWWRVVRADGSLPPSHDEEARQAYLEEGTPLRPSGSVDLGLAFWQPELRAE